jgi:glycosyltransferase involved in cell wall biosynthesis
MANLSVVIITFNEEGNLARCLNSVSWAEEIVIVDSFSQDRTKEVASDFTDKIYDKQWPGFGPAKQFAVEKTSNEWVLSVDADEEVSLELKEQIRRALNSDSEVDGYYLCRQSYFLGKWIRHGGWYPDYVLRLFRKNKAEFTDSKVHEKLTLKGKSAYLNGTLFHYTDPDLESYLAKMNRYTSLSAEELYTEDRRSNLMDILFRPVAIFFKMYILKLGFLDGIQGFLLATYSSIHVLTKYTKLWHLGRVKRGQGC